MGMGKQMALGKLSANATIYQETLVLVQNISTVAMKTLSSSL